MSEIIRAVELIRPQVEFVYFDLGGVVFNFSGGIQAISKRLQVPENEISAMWRRYDDAICRGDLHPQEFWEILNNTFGTLVELDFLTFWMDHFSPIDSTHQAMRELSSSGMNVGILTNIYPGVYEKALERGVIPDLPYSAVIRSCEVGLVKPDPQIFHYAAETSGYRAPQILLIDDRSENIQGADAAGWNSFQFVQE